jgi:hypothetical protein
MTSLTKKQYIIGSGIILGLINFFLVWTPVLFLTIFKPTASFPQFWENFLAKALALQPTVFLTAFISAYFFWNQINEIIIEIIMAITGTIQFFLIGLLIGYIIYKIKSRKH